MRLKPGRPATLREASLLDKPIVLRPHRVTDARAWREIRVRNAQWLRPWEMTDPESPKYPVSVRSYLGMLAGMRCEALLGRALPWAVTFGGELVGNLTIERIVWGSERTGQIAGWIDARHARHGIMTIAAAMAVDHALRDLGLHRITANIRPENTPCRVGIAEKLGFREEGLWVRQAYVDGAWRDHLCYALTAEEVPHGGFVTSLHSAGVASKSGALRAAIATRDYSARVRGTLR
jgi:[ribosomal protein S5]-alanine N-acetyltransferase